MIDSDVLWLAGLLEGEGTFDLQRGLYPRVRVAMTDRDVVGRVASLFDSTIRLTLLPLPKAPIWHAEIQGSKAVAIMRTVLPHMGARRSQKIAEILSAYAARNLGPDFRGQASGLALTRPPATGKPRSVEQSG